ncbi:secreted protein [Seminavis robusta]|uniref:Secreted protein n=1 Tax=Seminavis robusta TaxID=568900 RepID=A0A9N8DNW2_9STRA|nr:secreted protein [Seminavis robusta]|eukprot:Sro183_g079700.1 secreted protein (357) ;mRNA; r:61132-62202
MNLNQRVLRVAAVASSQQQLSIVASLSLTPTLWLSLAATNDIHSSTSTAASTQLLESSVLDLQKSKQYKKDTVARILDPNTIKLDKNGLVALAGVQTPSTGGFPDCTSYSPSKQLRKSLPKGTTVKVRFLDEESSSSSAAKRVLLLRETPNPNDDAVLVNAELIESGYAKPVARGRKEAEKILPGFTAALEHLNQQAQDKHVGLYEVCTADAGTRLVDSPFVSSSSSKTSTPATSDFPLNLDDQFEPLAFTTQTQWGADGGKTIRVDNTANSKGTVPVVPINPGDSRGCSDFGTYEEALSWYERYLPYYGDVAKLDRDGDGIPCPKLPHTKNMDRFRRKVPVVSSWSVDNQQNKLQ